MINYLDLTGYGFISLGVLFNLLSAITLIRYPDIYTRLLTSTKCITIGTTSIMFGIVIMNGFSAVGIKSLICLLVILLISPVESHVLLRAAKKQGIKMCKETLKDKYDEDLKKDNRHEISQN
ncbi:monovalent cation/H(+) antiporter subunit G [Elusimicrobiota bacterium]